MKTALLFGGTGAVGKACLDVLRGYGDVSVVTAGRDQVDLTDSAAVTAAAGRCDVVINCAGPSQRLSAHVAAAVIAAGVPYVDPGGDQTLLDHLAAIRPTVPVVLQAGVQPGLSGLLLRALALHRTDEIDGITAWCGGLQRLTPASVLEYLASLRDTHSHPGAALSGGTIRRIGRDECRAAPARHFPGSVTVNPHLDAETVSVAAHLGIGNVCWMNVFDGVHTTRAMQMMAVSDERDVSAVLAAAKLDLFGRQTYFAIVASADVGSDSWTAAFSCPDSFRATGAATAFAAGHIAGLRAGVHPFWSIDEPRRVLRFVTEAVPEAQLSFTEDPAPTMIEEGSL